MGKHWARQQVKRDELADLVERGISWVSRNRQTAGLAAGAVLAALAIAGGTLYRGRSMNAAAWNELASAQQMAYGGRADAAQQRVKELLGRYAGTRASGYGLLFAGDMLYSRAQYKEALDSYSRILETGEPKALQSVALSDLALAQEVSENCRQAAQSAQRFLSAYPDHFLAPQVHACLARCLQVLGQPDQAKAAYQKIVLQYPDTYWSSWAKTRLEPGAKK